MSSPTDITKKNNYIENSIFKFKPDIILKGDVYGTDYDYKYNINTNKSSQYQEFCVTNIAKINIQKIKSNFSSYLKYTNYDKELLNKDLRKKYLLQLFTNKFVLNKILNDKNNTILVIEPTIESNFKSIQDNEKKISKQYEILKPINEDILRLETKKTSIEKKRQPDDSKKKNEIENTRKNLLKDLDKVKKNKESLLSDLTKSIDMRETIKDDKKKISELLKLNSKIETTKQAIKEDDKSIASIEKKIKTLESKVEKEKKTSELDNLNRLLQEYIRNKEEILKIIKELHSQNDSLNKVIREKNKEILQHNIKILITEVFPRNSLYYLNSNQLKIII
jgi:chromosome segregation ATPase